MNQSSNPTLYLGKRKLSKDRKSIDSWIDYEDDGSDFSEVDHHLDVPIRQPEASFEQKFDSWADALAQVFIRRRPKRYIDINEGFVSKEESEYRLLLLYLVCSCIICLITTSLMIVCPFYCNNQNIIYFKYESKEIQNATRSLKVPHLLVMYEDGQIIDFSTNEALSPSRNVTMKLESKSGIFGYYAYADLQNIYIFYSQGRKDITYIDCQTLQHRTLSNTKLPKQKHKGIGVRVGDIFLIAGGHWYTNANLYPQNHYTSQPYYTNESISWSVKKKMYLKVNPPFKFATVEESCLTSVNRTHYLIINAPLTNGDVTLINIETWREIPLPRLPFAKLPDLIQYNYSHYWYNNPNMLNQTYRVTCAVDFSKDHVLKLNVIAKTVVHQKICDLNSNSKVCVDPDDAVSTMYQLDFKSMKWTKSITTIEHFGSLVVLNGINHFINIPNDVKNFGYFYNLRNKTWLQLSAPQLYFKDTSKWVDLQSKNFIVLAPYNAPLK